MDIIKTPETEKQAAGKICRAVRFALWAVFEAFALGSFCFVLFEREVTRVLISGATVLLLLLPYAAMRLLKCELNTAFFVFCLLYAIGPLLGHVYGLYYTTDWWDDLLHASAGVVFACFGAFLAELINSRGETTHLMKVLFALFFSIALAALWEIFEYGCDALFGFDMQNDVIVNDISSYLLGDAVGRRGVITGIEDIIIGGRSLGLGGYLDIGLHDTMSDMIRESLGAVVFATAYYLDSGRHTLVCRLRGA